MDSSVPLMYHEPRDLGLICLIEKHKIHFRILSDLRIQSWIFLKKRTLNSQFFCLCDSLFTFFCLSFKELLDDPYSDLKSFADSALSEQDSSQGEKVIITDSDVFKQPFFLD